jgi:hypothetical protein
LTIHSSSDPHNATLAWKICIELHTVFFRQKILVYSTAHSP